MPSCLSSCSLMLPPYADRYACSCAWYVRRNSPDVIAWPSTLAMVSPEVGVGARAAQEVGDVENDERQHDEHEAPLEPRLVPAHTVEHRHQGTFGNPDGTSGTSAVASERAPRPCGIFAVDRTTYLEPSHQRVQFTTSALPSGWRHRESADRNYDARGDLSLTASAPRFGGPAARHSSASAALPRRAPRRARRHRPRRQRDARARRDCRHDRRARAALGTGADWALVSSDLSGQLSVLSGRGVTA